ncbi:hypothetical protein [Azohydromonas lata]|uniref:Lipoprotein n=1 Tax=Azohydromonas lata TaxID=45677 RepID=A0ABU5IJR6_9BURK|nr:hypothetical protein [Azohydromonas lata]MDZ5459143.1 hypothetical protein [Azohydromonas lata]
MKTVRVSLSALSALAALALGGCAYNTIPYSASAKNVEKIKGINIQPVAIEKFTAATPGKDSIACRAAGSVTVKPNFETYIEQAFIDELKIASAYDAKAATKLSGKIDNIDFSSGITDGNWTISLTLTNGKAQSYTTKTVFPFSGSFVAEKACQEVAQSFNPAVQKLIQDVVSDPKFKTIASQ